MYNAVRKIKTHKHGHLLCTPCSGLVLYSGVCRTLIERELSLSKKHTRLSKSSTFVSTNLGQLCTKCQALYIGIDSFKNNRCFPIANWFTDFSLHIWVYKLVRELFGYLASDSYFSLKNVCWRLLIYLIILIVLVNEMKKIAMNESVYVQNIYRFFPLEIQQ